MPVHRLLATLLFAVAVHSQAQAQLQSHGIVLANMDQNVQPGVNFYLYANGAWVKRTDIPADRIIVANFSQLGDASSVNIARIIADAQKSPITGEQQRIADLYTSYMDEGTIEAHALAPLTEELARIANITTPLQLAEAFGRTLRSDVDALNAGQFHTANVFGLWVAPGFHDPRHYAPYFFQGGLTLPSRDYYLDSSSRMAEVRAAYATHAATLFRLAGFDRPEDRAKAVIALETNIAKGHISLTDSENIHKADNLWSAADFASKAPGLNWKVFFAAASLATQPTFYIWQPTAITAEAALVASTPIDTWCDFLRLHTIERLSPSMPKAFADESFHIFGTILYDAPQQLPRERRAVDLVNYTLGEAIGSLYVRQFFPPQSKAQVQTLVANLLAVYRTRLESISWMTPSTKAEALRKLQTLRVSVGYPNHFRTYDGLDIRPDDLPGNLERSSLFEYHYNLSRIGQPIDQDEWSLTPQTVNAVEMPLNNALVFPAAILQPPFFDPDAPLAANYGAIGTIIGHEISHTFDSEGADFDAEGRVRDWWTASDRIHFEASTAALAAQFDTYEVLPGLHVNGRQTLGENIADLAGLNAAFDAYHSALKSSGKSAPIVGGLTGDQQFFIAFSQNWQIKAREAALRSLALVDGHAPGPVRANTVRNLDAWYAAFKVKPTQDLYLSPPARVQIF